ncbi:hypothetical protein [Paracoccus sp. (in: a-proteobacteria)]|uniref:hypothetical protein n=1 Tax=Paracoccus sp. TaxID=267 RepID=UPI003A85E5D1
MQISIFLRVAGAAAIAFGLTACDQMSRDERNAAVGAAGGAVIAEATDSNVVAGAAIGGAAGALCDDAGICQ